MCSNVERVCKFPLMSAVGARQPPQLGPLFFSTCGESCGVLWSTVRLAADNSCEAVCWSPELQLYACVTGSGLRVMTSPNGVNWSNQPQLGSR